MKNDKKYAQIIDTDHAGPLVTFKVCDPSPKNTELQGLYKGLNELVLGMNLGDEVSAVITSDLAFGTIGLDRYYEPGSGGYLKNQIGILGTQMPNDPNAPKTHHNRNPLCIAYIGVQPNASVMFERMALMEVNNHKREIPSSDCIDCCWSSISNGLGWNSGTF